MDNEEENELVVEDVPETSQDNVSEVETDTSEVVDETQDSADNAQKSDEDIEKRIEERAQERANQLFEEKVEQRIIRDRVKQEEKFNQKLGKYEDLLNIVNSGLGTNGIDEAINRASEYYKEQGIDIPVRTKENHLSERQETILAEAEANEIIACGTKEMEYEANRIAQIPLEKRTLGEKIILKSLAEKLISQRDINELKTKGYDTKILDSEDFNKFRNKFAATESISEVFEMYQKLNGANVKREPRSPGSAKGVVSDNEIKELYTPDEVKKFTEEDLKNPKLMRAVENSMIQWRKNGSK